MEVLPYIIVFCSTMTICGIVTVIMRKKAKKKTQEGFDGIDFGVNYAVSLLNGMGCQCEVDCKEKTDEGSEWIRYRFSYQGAVFYLTGSVNSVFVGLILSGIDKRNFNEIDMVRTACNMVNVRTGGGSRVEYEIVNNKEDVITDVVSGFAIMSLMPSSIGYLTTILDRNFEIREMFASVLDAHREEQRKSKVKDVEKEYAMCSREMYLLRERELAHGRKARIDLNVKSPTLLDFVRKTLSSEDILLHRMMVVTSTGEVRNCDEEEISSYCLYGDIIDVSGGIQNAEFKCDWVSYTIDYSEETDRENVKKLQLLFVKDYVEGKTLYLRATITVCGLPFSQMVTFASKKYQGYAKTLLLAFDKVSDVSKNAEFEFMFKDMEDKLKAKRLNELSDEQMFMADCYFPNVQEKLYFGRKYFNEKRYFDAIGQLECVFPNLMKADVEKMTYKETHTSREIIFMLGFCYAELEQYEKALYYLEMISFNSDVKYDMEYINCLVNSGDFRALPTIDRAFEQVNNALRQYDEEDENMEPLIKYRDFLLRRRCYVLVEKGQLDEAEKMLQTMIDDERNCDFALGELAYIKKLREEVGQDECLDHSKDSELPDETPA